MKVSDAVLKELRLDVEAGGGKWVGLQEDLTGENALVLFDSPVTHTTLALPWPDVTAESVRKRIERSNRKFQKMCPCEEK